MIQLSIVYLEVDKEENRKDVIPRHENEILAPRAVNKLSHSWKIQAQLDENLFMFVCL